MEKITHNEFQKRMKAKTADEAASILGISRRTWYNQIEQYGEIPDPWIYKAWHLIGEKRGE